MNKLNLDLVLVILIASILGIQTLSVLSEFIYSNKTALISKVDKKDEGAHIKELIEFCRTYDDTPQRIRLLIVLQEINQEIQKQKAQQEKNNINPCNCENQSIEAVP